MNNSVRYCVEKSNKKSLKSNFNNELRGFELIKNRKKIVNGFVINNLELYNNLFIERAINKKIQKGIKTLLELFARIFEEDGDPGDSMSRVLDELERFKRLNLNQYISYMSKHQMSLLQKKIDLIEYEIKTRMNRIQIEIPEVESEKEVHRRR